MKIRPKTVKTAAFDAAGDKSGDWLLCDGAGEKRRRVAALQDAGALADRRRTARSVLECASPLALWKNGLVAGAGGVTVASAMKTLPAKAKNYWSPFLLHAIFL